MEGDSPSTGLFEEPLLEARDAGLPSDFPELPPCAPAQVTWVQDSETQLTDSLLAWDGLGTGLYQQHKAS